MSDEALPILAAVYRDGATFEKLLQRAVAALRADGLRLGGLIQHSVPNAHRRKCDMLLEDLSTGERYPISEDRGALASGCVLDTDRLLTASIAAENGLSETTDLLILSKFGKAETEGGGTRSLLAQALDLAVPILIGVPEVNRAAFETFAEGLYVAVDMTEADAAILAQAAMRLAGRVDLSEVNAGAGGVR
jgi:nucleoside-triphosphatase THEP1